MRRPKVSAVIVTWNRKEPIQRCIDSLLSSIRPFDEIVVVDNGAKIRKPKLGKAKLEFKFIRSERNLGAAAGRNLGIKNSNGDYIFFIDADATVDKRMLGLLIQVFRKNKLAAIIQPKILDFYDQTLIQGIGHDINLVNGRVRAWGVMEKDYGQYDKLFEVPMVGGIFLVKKSVLDQVGLFDETYFIPYEDSDLSIRVTKAGYKIYCYGKAKCWHIGKGKTVSKINPRLRYLGVTSAEFAYRVVRNKIIFMVKHAPKVNLIFFMFLFLPTYVIFHTLIILSIKRFDILFYYWRGLVSGIGYFLFYGLRMNNLVYYYHKLDNNLFSLKVKIDALVDPICKVIDKSAESILDVGCGEGYPMRLIRQVVNPKNVVGVDLFEEYINRAKKSKLHDSYILCDVRKMKLPDKSFDVVLASQIIEHLPKKDARRFIQNLERIAKKQVIIATPIGKMYHPPVDKNVLQLHLSHYFPQEFEKMGYKIVKYGRKSILGEEGLVHKIKYDLIRKFLFLLNIILSPIYYLFQSFADYYFVAYKNLSKSNN